MHDVFGAIYAADDGSSAALIEIAREFSPRLVIHSAREIVLDLAGLTRLFGRTQTIAEELRRTAAARGVQIRVAVAGTRTAARILVRHRAGLTVIASGTEAEALALLPLELLQDLSPLSPRLSASAWHRNFPNDPNDPNDPNGPNVVVRTLKRWGLRTLGSLAALPPDELVARLGQSAIRWQRAARGEDPGPLVPSVPEERFEQALDLEWPIEGLEPLSFVLGRLLEPLSAHLERRDQGAAVLHVRLQLVTREMHERSLQLPIAMREPRTLRTLILLDLESHPPPAAIDRVVIAVDPTPGRVVQFSLLTRPLPSPEQVSTLMARLQALMGEARCGSPVVVDSWEPGAFAMKPFAPVEAVAPAPRSGGLVASLRRFRAPIIARVQAEGGRPARVVTDRRELPGGRVESCAGPWRTSGQWWLHDARERRDGAREMWDRDEWDVTLADGGTYRIFRERRAGKWFVEGVVD
ncbi:MAG TPA: hypothetical protein VFV95_16845 [Vicinamibacterales bacterium]|nr:hypothetical protein [Vicinamibacterales bacterium]